MSRYRSLRRFSAHSHTQVRSLIGTIVLLTGCVAIILLAIIRFTGLGGTSVTDGGGVVASGVVAVNWQHFPLMASTAVYAYEAVGVVMPLQNAMAQPQKFARVLTLSLLFCTTCFLGAPASTRCHAHHQSAPVTAGRVAAMGLPCYLAWGSDTKGLVVDNLSPGPIQTSIRIGLMLTIVFTYPCQVPTLLFGENPVVCMCMCSGICLVTTALSGDAND